MSSIPANCVYSFKEREESSLCGALVRILLQEGYMREAK